MERRVILLLLAWTLLVAPPVRADAPDESEPFDFWLSEAHVRRLAEEDTILSRTRVSLNHRTKKVHTIDDDCEIHIAATSATQLASPSGIVVEPPNLCKERAPGMPPSSEKKLREELWPKFLDQRVMNRECDVTGFPRIFTEHASGNQDPANPNHVLEIHPALRFECDGSQPVDMRSFLKVYPKMRQIKPATAADCIKNRELYVRKQSGRYEFAERGGQCGNFAKFHVSIFPQWVRKIAGGHSAIARVSPTGVGIYTLKLYTYDGTPEDQLLATIGGGTPVSRRLYFHGLFTYDYFAIVRTLRAPDRVTWLDPPTWTRVTFPLAFVTFGEGATEGGDEE